MTGVTILLVVSFALAGGIGLLQLIVQDRRQQQRDGLFGKQVRQERTEADERALLAAARLAREVDAAHAALQTEGRRLAKLRARIRRIDRAEPGWWWMSFSEGTVMLLRSSRERALARLSRSVGRDEVRLTGVDCEADGISKLVLQVRHRPVAVYATSVTVARRPGPGH